MSAPLAVRLHAQHVEHLVRSAEAIRDWPAGSERLDQAMRHIREAMYLCTIGKLNQAEESQLFSILSFAMPASDARFDEPEA